MGSIVRLSIKPEVAGMVGLPKHAVASLRVTLDGAEGDYNNYRTRRLAGDRDQALLVVTQELLIALAADGWPVRPGDLGENVTVSGIREGDLRPGVQLQMGEVTVAITKPCDPCTELFTLPYVGEERGPAFLAATAGRRGWYAKVLTPGEITAHSSVTLRSPERWTT
jgi:MOSC domain-containing protein YiiM